MFTLYEIILYTIALCSSWNGTYYPVLKIFYHKTFYFFLKWTHSIPLAYEKQDKSGIKLLIELAINMRGKLASNFIYGINLEESWPLCSVLDKKPLVPERTDNYSLRLSPAHKHLQNLAKSVVAPGFSSVNDRRGSLASKGIKWGSQSTFCLGLYLFRIKSPLV